MEIAARFDHDGVGPASVEKGPPLGLDRRALRFPEILRACEIAVLAEQVGDDPALVGCKVEDGVAGRDGRAAEQS
jgi:hypothetical protein